MNDALPPAHGLDSGHDPVLPGPLLEALRLKPGMTVVDCTLGRAGHAGLVAAAIGPTGTLIALDVDPRNLEYARASLGSAPARFRFFHANFAELDEVLSAAAVEHIDAIYADLGVSTNQIFDSAYGLSFSDDMPLDMRLDPRIARSAADWVNQTPEGPLADVLYKLAQERYSRRIARKIVETRRVSPILTTKRLAELVRQAVGHVPIGRIDPATRTFLALRMAVNQEAENLSALLKSAPRRLAAGGRLAIISFQSTEDRLVKHALKAAEAVGVVRVLSKRPIEPDEAELNANPRSRSAKLRFAEKIG